MCDFNGTLFYYRSLNRLTFASADQEVAMRCNVTECQVDYRPGVATAGEWSLSQGAHL